MDVLFFTLKNGVGGGGAGRGELKKSQIEINLTL